MKSLMAGFVQTTNLAPKHVRAEYMLGPWCHHEWRRVATLFDCDARPIVQAQEYAELHRSLYLGALDRLSSWLDSIHHMNMPQSYWELILYRFLSDYVGNFLGRYLIMTESSHAISATFITLCSRDFYTPANDRELGQLMQHSGLFNLQMFSQIASALETPVHEMRRREFEGEGNGDPMRPVLKVSRTIRQRAVQALRVLRGQSAPAAVRVGLLPTHLPLETIRALKNYPELSLAEIAWSDQGAPRISPSLAMREHLSSDSSNRLARSLLRSLQHNLPIDYVEAFHHWRKAAKAVEAKQPPELILAGYIPSLTLRIWAAEQCFAGSKLFFVQHGGNYGESVFAPWELCERNLSNKFITWGWDGERTVALGAPRLVQFKLDTKRGGHLLFVAREVPLYPSSTTAVVPSEQSAASERRLLTSLPKEIRQQTVVRLCVRKGALRASQSRLFADIEGISIDREESIRAAYNQARLIIAGYLFSTTFLECLAANRPVIVFDEHRSTWIRRDALEFYDKLREAGIVHFSAQSAAQAICHAFDRPDEWWHEPKRHKVASEFAARFALAESSDRAAERWAQWLKTALKETYPVTSSCAG